MSRSMGGRARHSRPTATVRRVLRSADGKRLHPGTVSREDRMSATWEKVHVGHMFWISAEIVLAPIGPLGMPTGENLVRRPGATVRKVIDRRGVIGYCHEQQYAELQERERLAMIEGTEKEDASTE